ncbi:MAG: uL30 family ribosomal protein [Candidatus Pacearchaeota archaeon]
MTKTEDKTKVTTKKIGLNPKEKVKIRQSSIEGRNLCIVRISGKVGLNKDVIETLDRLRLRKKYSCIVMKPTKEQAGMIKKIRSFVAYGDIKNDILEKLIANRGQPADKSKKIDSKKAAEGITKGEKFEDLNLRPFFRLHPARKGMVTKFHFPKGVLGDNGDKINDLVERML